MPKAKEPRDGHSEEGEEAGASKKPRQEETEGPSITLQTSQQCETHTVSTETYRRRSYSNLPEDLTIGSCICPSNFKSCGTVGPFVKIKETGELCFLTARHIFGPFRSLEKFLGTEVLLKMSEEDQNADIICGHVIAEEFDESLDVVLVKVSQDFVPNMINFSHVSDENLKDSGLNTTHFPFFCNINSTVDARKLSTKEIETHKVVKFSRTTGMTVGKFFLSNGHIRTNSYNIRRDAPDYSRTDVMTYQNQFRVEPVGENAFAKESDAGAAVYLLDKTNRLRCVGIISRVIDYCQGVLVTPIQEIMESLELKLEKKLDIVTIHSNNQNSDEREDQILFSRALSEGQEHDRHLRVNIIGFYAQGKTTLTRRLLNESVNKVESTDGIDVHIRRCKIKENNWERFNSNQEFDELSCRLVSVAINVANNSVRSPNTENDDVFDLSEDITEQTVPKVANNSMHTNFTLCEEPIGRTVTTEQTIHDTSVKCLPLFRRFAEELTENRTISEDELIATIWDFGGQFVYYATHQIFHSRDAVYLLVFDLRKELDNVLEDLDFPDRQEKMKTSLMFWVNSINAFVGTDDGSQPKVILVGTHKDKFKGNIEAKFKEVKELFAGTDVRNHICDRTFAVATVDMSDGEIDELRNTIYRIGEDTASQRLIPAKWIPLELALLEVRKRNIITFREVLDMDAKNDQPIGNKRQIKVFLKYHHEKGTLVFFDEEELSNHVILNPQFLIDAFRCIITSKTICDGSSELYRLWKKMTNMAVLEKRIIEAVWSKDSMFHEYTDILLNFLKRHRILAELQKDDSSDKLVGMGKYMIPSFLKSNCSDETTDLFLAEKTYSSVLLGICLENNTVLSTVYERITAAALGRWSPIKFEDQYLVFQNVGYYRLDRQHAGRITKNDGKGIELMVIVLCPSGEDIDVVSDRFRRYVEMVISQEFWKLHNEARENLYSHYIKCNHPDHGGRGSKESHSLKNIEKEIQVCCPDYKNHPINVRLTKDEWFQEEKIAKVQTSYVRLATEKDLNKIAQAIGTNWELLGIALGLSADKIDRIKQRSHDSGTATVIFYMLKEWKNQYPDDSSLNKLIDTIRETDVLSLNWDKIRNLLDNF